MRRLVGRGRRHVKGRRLALGRCQQPGQACQFDFGEPRADMPDVGEPAVVVAPEPRRVDVVFRCQVAEGADADAIDSRSPEIDEAQWVARESLPDLQHEASGALVALARMADATTIFRR